MRAPVGVDQPPQLAHVHLQRLGRGRRRPRVPERVDQRVGGHRLAEAERECGEDHPLLGRADGHRPAVAANLDGTQDRDLDPVGGQFHRARDLGGEHPLRGVKRRLFGASERGKLARQPLDHESRQVFVLIQILEPDRSERPHRHPFGQLVAGKCRGQLREQHLAAVPRRTDPRRTMHVQPDVALAGHLRLAGVHTDPHPHLDAVRPRRLGQRPLHRHRRRDRVPRPREHREGASPCVSTSRPPERANASRMRPARVLRQHRTVLPAELPQQPG